MKNSIDFKTDLAYGERAEELFDGYFRNKEFEIKRDRLMHETGRCYIEYESRGRRSGIAMDDIRPLWIYTSDDCSIGFMMDAERLRETIRIYKKECEQGLIEPPAHWNKEGGDDNTSRGALIDVKDLVRIMLSLVKPVSK